MKSLLGNSCAKGCLVYFTALVLIVILTAIGIGGLSAKFGAGAQSARSGISALSTSGQPGASLPGIVADANPPATTVAATAPPAPTLPVAQAQTGTGTGVGTAPQAQGQAQPSLPLQAQDGGATGISAQTVSPFYIVQPGDTLWEIARQYGLDVDALRIANSIASDSIQPGQLLYLPQVGQQAATPGAPQSGQQAPAPAPAQPDQGTGIPALPHTGINGNP